MAAVDDAPAGRIQPAPETEGLVQLEERTRRRAVHQHLSPQAKDAPGGCAPRRQLRDTAATRILPAGMLPAGRHLTPAPARHRAPPSPPPRPATPPPARRRP